MGVEMGLDAGGGIGGAQGAGLEADFVAAVGLGLAGLAISALMERFLVPRPRLRRPPGAWEAHAGLFLAVYGALALLSKRPWCSLAASTAIMLTLILVNNAKMRSLKEPFVAQDYEYFIDTLLHPRLFLPFLGVKNFFQAAALFALALLGFIYEPTPEDRFLWAGQGGGLAVTLGCAGLCLALALRRPLKMSFEPCEDMRRVGLLASIWAYVLALRHMPDIRESPFAQRKTPCPARMPLPHLVAVQSESFFDPRPLYAGIRNDALKHFDGLRRDSAMRGKLRVPAWGANTVRTEFAFLSGLPQEVLGAHRFNPYNMVAAGHPIPSLPLFLKSLGYAAICIHPYSAGFYRRKKVFQIWGFDKFIDIRCFARARRFGPYTLDTEAAKAVIAELRRGQAPLFIYAITMENHGPLHLERARPKDMAALYHKPPPPGCDDLTVYLRHLRHADKMLHMLREELQGAAAAASLCWYGDHVPIMPGAYAALAGSPADTDYVIWNNTILNARLAENCPEKSPAPKQADQHAHDLAPAWMKIAGIHS